MISLTTLDQLRDLSGIELRVFLAIHLSTTQWMRGPVIVRHVWGPRFFATEDEGMHALRNAISRMKPKLEGTSWAIQNRYAFGQYRVIGRASRARHETVMRSGNVVSSEAA